MDFKTLREQILPNIENYTAQETKIVMTKLLDLLIDIDEKHVKIKNENDLLETKISELKNNKTEIDNLSDEKTLSNQIEANNIIEKAREEANVITSEAEESAKILVTDTEIKLEEMKEAAFNQISLAIDELREKDKESQLYRSHILTVFRKAIFRFSDSNYYIIRSDNQDFQELLQFFETDNQLQQICDNNIAALINDPKYIKITKEVKDKSQLTEFDDVNNIFFDNKITIDNNNVENGEITQIEEEIEQVVNLPEIVEERAKPKKNLSFLEVINQYKNH